MADMFSIEERSRIMKAVKSKGNKSTELKLIELFKRYMIKGWRRGYEIVGNPDFVFCKYRVAVFVDGCFWHGHNCRNLKPLQNEVYWYNKIMKNKSRDELVNQNLKRRGWRVFRIWECELKNGTIPKVLLGALKK